MLEIRSLTAGYPGKPVLEAVSACIPCGAVTAVVGPNGCGKSTLLKAICGLLPAAEGSVRLAGEELRGLDPRARARRMAYLAQSRQIPDITAGRLVLHGRFPYLSYPRRYRPQDEAAALEAMTRMGVAELAEARLQELSGGQRQKVYLAMALAQQTPVILLDEPTTYLDVSHQLQLMHLTRDLAGQGKTVVMVVHDLPLALAHADHLLLMSSGRIERTGTPREVYASGALEKVFGVRLGCVATESGERYYCMEA